MDSPLSTENPTPVRFISNFLTSAVCGMPSSLEAQKQRRLAFVLTINGESVSNGETEMHTMLRLLIIIEVIK